MGPILRARSTRLGSCRWVACIFLVGGNCTVGQGEVGEGGDRRLHHAELVRSGLALFIELKWSIVLVFFTVAHDQSCLANGKDHVDYLDPCDAVLWDVSPIHGSAWFESDRTK